MNDALRVKGFVCGKNELGKWLVRVRAELHSKFNEKIIVLSMREGTCLETYCTVDFVISHHAIGDEDVAEDVRLCN